MMRLVSLIRDRRDRYTDKLSRFAMAFVDTRVRAACRAYTHRASSDVVGIFCAGVEPLPRVWRSTVKEGTAEVGYVAKTIGGVERVGVGRWG